MKINLAFILFCLMLSCSEKTSKTEIDSPNSGEITIATDEAYQNVVKQLVYRYTIDKPDAKINLSVEPENKALKNFFERKTRAIVLSRQLKPNEMEYFTKVMDEDYEPAYFAADAVCFVVPKNSSITQLSFEGIKTLLQSDNSPFIFDNSNSSNINFVSETLGIPVKKMKYKILESNENIVNEINKYSGKIGVVSYNTFSREYEPKSIEMRSKINILPIFFKNKLVKLEKSALRDQSYPFTKMLYYLTNERYYGLANGLIRYSCTQIGQLIVGKQGLQAFTIYPRNVEIKEGF